MGFRELLDSVAVGEWNIGLIDSSLEDLVRADRVTSSVPGVRWLQRSPFVRVQADPFLLSYQGRCFLYYEEIPFWSSRGRLRYLELDADGTPIDRPAAMIGSNGHASYPYVFQHMDAFYCVPESDFGPVTLYRSDDPAGPWRSQVDLLDGVSARDCTLFPFNDRWWLFCTVAGTHRQSHLSDLHVWHAPAPWGSWEPHRLQPVKADLCSSRPAGRPFVVDGTLYRPAQDCSSPVWMHAWS